MIFINGKFYIQGQSIHDVFQLTHSPQKFPPGCFQCAFIHIPDHFHHPACRSTGNAVGGSRLIIIDQIIRFIALNISGKHYTTADHMERLTLNQHLFIWQILNVFPIRSDYRVNCLNDFFLAGRIYVQNTFIMSRIGALKRILRGWGTSYHNSPSLKLVHNLMADFQFIHLIIPDVENIHFFYRRFMNEIFQSKQGIRLCRN